MTGRKGYVDCLESTAFPEPKLAPSCIVIFLGYYNVWNIVEILSKPIKENYWNEDITFFKKKIFHLSEKMRMCWNNFPAIPMKVCLFQEA